MPESGVKPIGKTYSISIVNNPNLNLARTLVFLKNILFLFKKKAKYLLKK